MLAEWTWPVWFLCAVIVTDLVVLTDLVVKEVREKRASAVKKKRRLRSTRVRSSDSLAQRRGSVALG
jgi:hypothetical protein